MIRRMIYMRRYDKLLSAPGPINHSLNVSFKEDVKLHHFPRQTGRECLTVTHAIHLRNIDDSFINFDESNNFSVTT